MKQEVDKAEWPVCTIVPGVGKRVRSTDFLQEVVADWFSTDCSTIASAIADLAVRPVPDLVIVMLNERPRDHLLLARQIRALPGPIGTVPVLAYAAADLDETVLRDNGIDAVLPARCSAAEIADRVAGWSPAGWLDGITRLAAAFGAAEIAPIVAAFHTQIGEAVAELDHRTNRTTAHQIAGIAGTLGFHRLGQSWLAVSEGDETMRDSARRDARVALHALNRPR